VDEVPVDVLQLDAVGHEHGRAAGLARERIEQARADAAAEIEHGLYVSQRHVGVEGQGMPAAMRLRSLMSCRPGGVPSGLSGR
jgi:hypothetical protein